MAAKDRSTGSWARPRTVHAGSALLDEWGEAAELAEPHVVLVDVREPTEVADGGVIPGAIPAPRGMLDFHADPASPYHLAELKPDARVILYCKSGARSALAGAALKALGYQDVAHLEGGITAWNQAQRPTAGVGG